MLIFIHFIIFSLFAQPNQWGESQGLYGTFPTNPGPGGFNGSFHQDDEYIYDHSGAVLTKVAVVNAVNFNHGSTNLYKQQSPVNSIGQIYYALNGFVIDTAKRHMVKTIDSANYSKEKQVSLTCEAIDHINNNVGFFPPGELDTEKHLAALGIFSLLHFEADSICQTSGKKVIDKLRELKLAFNHNDLEALRMIDHLVEDKLRIDKEFRSTSFVTSTTSTELNNEDKREGAFIRYNDQCKEESNLSSFEYEVRHFLKTLRKQERKYNAWHAGELSFSKGSNTCTYDFRFNSSTTIKADTKAPTTRKTTTGSEAKQ